MQVGAESNDCMVFVDGCFYYIYIYIYRYIDLSISTCMVQPIASFFFVFFYLTYSRWTSPLPSCLWSQRIFPSLPGSRLTIFYRDVSSALLQLVNQWLIRILCFCCRAMSVLFYYFSFFLFVLCIGSVVPVTARSRPAFGGLR